METEVKVDGLILLSHGTLVARKDSTFSLNFENSFDVRIVLNESGEQGIKGKSVPGGIELELIGFNSPLGTATIKPIDIAKRGDKTIFISLSVYAINDSRIIIYNVLSEA